MAIGSYDFLFALWHESACSTVSNTTFEVSFLVKKGCPGTDGGPYLVRRFLYSTWCYQTSKVFWFSKHDFRSTVDGKTELRIGSCLSIFQFFWITLWMSDAFVLYCVLNLMELERSLLGIRLFLPDLLNSIAKLTGGLTWYCVQYLRKACSMRSYLEPFSRNFFFKMDFCFS